MRDWGVGHSFCLCGSVVGDSHLLTVTETGQFYHLSMHLSPAAERETLLSSSDDSVSSLYPH